MAVALHESGFLDGLHRWLRSKYPRFQAEDIREVVAEAVRAVYTAVHRGGKVRSLPAFLYKVASAKAAESWRQRRREAPLEGAPSVSSFEGPVPTIPDDLYERRWQEALAGWRSLLPMLGPRQRDVLAYVFDGLVHGREDVPEVEIAEALGISEYAVHVALWRGKRRLLRLGRERGFVGPHFKIFEAAEGQAWQADDGIETREPEGGTDHAD